MLAVVLVLCAVAAWWLRTRDGAVRVPTDGTAAVVEVGVLRALGVRPEAAALTVVQFSTATCAPCRTTRALLDRLTADHRDLAVVHVDAEEHLAAVRDLDVRRTPTLFYVDSGGALLGRSSGAPRPEALAELVGSHTGTWSEGTR